MHRRAQFSFTSTIFIRLAVSFGSAPKRSIISAAKASIALPVLEVAETAVEAHAQVEVGHIEFRDHDWRVDADLRRELFLPRTPPAFTSRIASSSIDW